MRFVRPDRIWLKDHAELNEKWVQGRVAEDLVQKADETDRQLEEASLDLMPYKSGKYRIRFTTADLARHEALLRILMKRAYDQRDL